MARGVVGSRRGGGGRRLKPWHRAPAPHFSLERWWQDAGVNDDSVDLEQPCVGVVFEHLASAKLGRERVDSETAADQTGLVGHGGLGYPGDAGEVVAPKVRSLAWVGQEVDAANRVEHCCRPHPEVSASQGGGALAWQLAEQAPAQFGILGVEVVVDTWSIRAAITATPSRRADGTLDSAKPAPAPPGRPVVSLVGPMIALPPWGAGARPATPMSIPLLILVHRVEPTSPHSGRAWPGPAAPAVPLRPAR